jgi:hypothetical protein
MPRHMAVRDRINSVNAKLNSAAGVRGIFIHPRCKNLLNSIAKQTFKEGTVLPDKTQGFDHMNDALGYLISFLYPIKTFYESTPVERFTVKTGVPR